MTTVHPFYNVLRAVLEKEENANSSELRSTEFHRIPSATRLEYLTNYSGRDETQVPLKHASKEGLQGNARQPASSKCGHPTQPENAVYEKIPFMINDLSDTTLYVSLQFTKWTSMLRKIRNHSFTRQFSHIVASCFAITMEFTPEISKFRLLYEMFHNRFINDAVRDYVMTLFQKSQRCYYGFSKLARVFRFKHTPVQITTDLYMSDLSISHTNTFVLLDTNRIYHFSLKDLARILTEALTFSYSFLSEPTVCKNPYNNIPFSKSTLYNIYFQMKTAFCIVPHFVQLFFEADFNVYKFKKRNEWRIREYKIREYITKTEPKLLIPDIIRMFRKYDTECKITIDPDIPPNKLSNNVKQLYEIYLCRKYCYCSIRSEYYENELVYKIDEFIRLNPTFGRKTHIAVGRHAIFPHTNDTFQFNTNIVLPERETHTEFMETHRYCDALYNRYIQYGVLAEPHNEEDDEPEASDENVNLDELRSLAFHRIPSATRPEYFTIPESDNREEPTVVDTDSDEEPETRYSPFFEEETDPFTESDTDDE
jgi:hypothetical protein